MLFSPRHSDLGSWPNLKRAQRFVLAVFFIGSLIVLCLAAASRDAFTVPAAIAVCATSAVSYVLGRKGHPELALALPLCVVAGCVFTSCYLYRGINDVGASLIPALILVAGLLLNRRFVFSYATVVILGAIGVMAGRWWVTRVKTFNASEASDLVLFVLTCVLSAAVTTRLAEHIGQSYRLMQENEERFDELARQSRTTVWEVDAQGLYTYVSPVFEAVWGYRPEEVVGRLHFYDLHPEEGREAFKTALFAVTERKEAFQDVVHAVVTKDGRTLWGSANGIPLLNADGTLRGYRGHCTDITERKRAEEKEKSLQLQLVQAQKMESIGCLAGGVAHDFNNLLTVINGYTTLALRQARPGDPQFHGLTEVLRAGERAAGLVRQLLAFGRKQMLQPEVLDLNAAVGETEEMLHRMMGEDVEIVVRMGPVVAPILADRHQIELVIVNLAANARDAMPEGGTLTLETGERRLESVCGVCHERIRPGTYIELTVSDTGTGMDAHILEHLFEPFFTTKGVGKGTGLGLSTVQGIVVQSGGHVHVESEVGKGSAFYIYLPLAESPKVEPDALPVAGSVGGTQTILLVEDQEEVRQFIATILGEYGYTVVQAQDADQALRLCTAAPVDLLVTDVVMPKMSGTELARRAQLALPGVRTLFISGYSEETHRQKWESMEGVQFLQKPFAPGDLAAKVRQMLEGR